MTYIILVIILIMGLTTTAQAHGVEINMERVRKMFEICPLLAKAIGSTFGSGIAVVFRPGEDSVSRLFSRFMIGAILGIIFAPVFIDYMTWSHEFDYWAASACFCGLVGYLMLEILYSKEVWGYINGIMSKWVNK